MSHLQLNPNSTQVNIKKIGFDTKMTLDHHHPPPPTQTQRHKYLSCYWSDFNQTLKEGSWDEQQQQQQHQHQKKNTNNNNVKLI